MAKRGYKLQEFVAHAGNVNCLRFGKKNCRKFITGGDDQKVNIWSVGKPTSVMSLCGHTSPVESATFDSSEVLVVAGSSSGAIKLWDLEETKIVRTLTGHRSYCTAVEFHPFGEFFASGSMDTNLKIWDIRKKGCIHTYKGHSRGISTIRFTPDGRWVVSGGFDNVVKVWDLTAGKLLHDFKFHEGHVRSIEFHPLEFLLATGSADKTVKFWDLETFEMIGSARREATGVRAVTFHPDGKTLFCGLDDSLKVYSWEPVICHDSVDMGWSTLGDLCISDGKLLGGAYYENSVAVWVADISLIEPHGTQLTPEQHSQSEQKSDSERSFVEKEESHVKVKSNMRATTPDTDSKEIKTIYVDCVNSITPKPIGSIDPPPKPVLLPLDSKEIKPVVIQKRILPTKTSVSSSGNRSLVMPSIVPRDDGKDSIGSRRESVGFAKSTPNNTRRISNNRFDMKKMSVSLNIGETAESTFNFKKIIEDRISSPATASSVESCDQSLNSSKKSDAVKFVNGVAVVHGRTRSLVERFERRENVDVEEIHMPVETVETPTSKVSDQQINMKKPNIISWDEPNVITREEQKIMTREEPNIITWDEPNVMPRGEPKIVPREEPMIMPREEPKIVPEEEPKIMPREEPKIMTKEEPKIMTREEPKIMTREEPKIMMRGEPKIMTRREPKVITRDGRKMITRGEPKVITGEDSKRIAGEEPKMITREEPKVITKPEPKIITRGNPKVITSEEPSMDDNNIIENLLQNHDVLLSTFRSRLTKLQVVRHFWERNDVKGAINAVRKLPDHFVQADVVSVLMERIEIITLDLFSCLLPMLLGLLESKVERHSSVSLEILLKLVAVFGTLVYSTMSAPKAVGVNLHAEERLECCKQCFTHLQKIQKILPELVKRGGVVAKFALQLNLVLRQ